MTPISERQSPRCFAGGSVWYQGPVALLAGEQQAVSLFDGLSNWMASPTGSDTALDAAMTIRWKSSAGFRPGQAIAGDRKDDG